jgi:4,5-DOPA dioxygenase extradiol
MNTPRLPVLFIAHGNPLLLDLPHRVAELQRWAQDLPTPKAILMISAHWQTSPIALGATQAVPLIYDFYGFPAKYYQLQYATPSSAVLAERVQTLLTPDHPKLQQRQERGLDHGAYVPLMCMYPDAQIPVVQLSLPSEDPKTLLQLGEQLRPLRDEGVMIMTSGYITHNLRQWTDEGVVAPWASEFDQWVADKIDHRDLDALANYQKEAPGARASVPTPEHFVPLFITLGAGYPDETIDYPITGFEFGSFSHRSIQVG